MLMYIVWTNSRDQRLSESSFAGFTDTLLYSQPYHGKNPHIGFFKKAMSTMPFGDRNFEVICRKISKDLRRIEEPVVFEPLVDCLIHFSKERWLAAQTSIERSVLSHSMAAFRTQICSHVSEDSRHERIGWYLRYVVMLVGAEDILIQLQFNPLQVIGGNGKKTSHPRTLAA